MKKIECIYEKGVLIPLEKLDIPERSKVTLSIEEVEVIDNLKLYSYLKLLREGEDAENLFEF
jgi:predicted DNA-binding antitoxin AbrB/MazE fold protein